MMADLTCAYAAIEDNQQGRGYAAAWLIALRRVATYLVQMA